MKWFNNLSILYKLLIGFTIVIIIIALQNVLLLKNIDNIKENNQYLSDNSLAPLNQLMKILMNMNCMNEKLLKLSYCVEDNKIELLRNNIEQINQEIVRDFKIFETLSIEEGEKNKIKKISTDYQNYYKTFLFYNKSGEQKKISEIIENISIGIQDNLVAVINQKREVANSISNSNKENYSRITNNMILFMGLVVVSVIIIIFIITYSVLNSMKRMVKYAENISSGDLRVEIPSNTNGEIGSMYRALIKIRDSYRYIFKEITNRTIDIAAAADDFLKLSEQVIDSSSEVLKQTNTNVTSNEQTSEKIIMVSSAAEQMSSSIKEISRNTNIAAKISRESQDNAKLAHDVMNRLGMSTTEINNIVKTITSIAEQTNLLALNATIEAVRAGDYGKGFGVVAVEVKELAKESARATEDITHRVKKIQEETHSASLSINAIINSIENISEISSSIASAVEQQAITTNEVNKNLNEASRRVRSIIDVNSGILKAMNQFSNISEDLKYGAVELNNLSKNLEDKVVNNLKV